MADYVSTEEAWVVVSSDGIVEKFDEAAMRASSSPFARCFTALVDHVRAQGLSSRVEEWTHQKPTRPGAYWIRGFELATSGGCALVEVALDATGTLIVNLHEKNSSRDFRCWYRVEDIDADFEWLGPLAMAMSVARQEVMG